MSRFSLAAAALALFASAAGAQQPPVKKDTAKAAHAGHQMDHGAMDHSAMHGQSGHAMSGWKELDSYHMLMMETWHPIKDKGDVAPIRAKATRLVDAARLLGKSTPPAKCNKPELKKAAADLVGSTEAVANLVTKKADDAALSAAMKKLHEEFEVLEEGCK